MEVVPMKDRHRHLLCDDRRSKEHQEQKPVHTVPFKSIVEVILPDRRQLILFFIVDCNIVNVDEKNCIISL
jgi:hypothetical protein